MKSIYQDEEFAKYWNNRVGDEGEDLKRFVLDPIMTEVVGELKGKTVLEIGCGNGYMGKKFLELNPEKVILSDISEENLKYVRGRVDSQKIETQLLDVTEKFLLNDNSLDVIYSNMVLNEIDHIENAIDESYRVLRDGGLFIFSALHPAYFLYHFAQEKMGAPKKYIDLEGYFSNKMCKYLMGSVSSTKSAVTQETKKNYEVDQKQRTIADYYNPLRGAGFDVKKIIEPQLTKELLEYNPGFEKYKDVPIAIIFVCYKDVKRA